MRKSLTILVFAWICHPVAAQDSTKVTTLREVVVSASRTEQAVIEVPRSVSVIHSDVIRKSVYQSLGDLLNAQAGIFVTGANQTPGTNQNVFLRGASSHQVTVLIDGIRVTDPSSPNSAVDLSEISLANVERIEVIRGSHSTMYGGAAIGGVINIITRRGDSKGLHGDASWQGGLFGNGAAGTSESINARYVTESGWYFDGSVFRRDVAGMDATEKQTGAQTFTADHDDFRKMDGSLKAGFKNLRWDAGASFRTSHQYTEIDNGAFADDDNSYLVFDRRLFQYKVQYRLSDAMRLSATGSLTDLERFYENDSSRVSETAYDKTYSTGSYYGKLQTHELQLNYELKRFTALLGAGVYREKMHFNNYFFLNDPAMPFESTIAYDSLDPRATTAFFFAQGKYTFGDFHLSGGSRISHHTMSGDFVTFEINPSFLFRDLLLYGSLTSGFNAPSLYQLYDPSRSFGSVTSRGNEDLRPERSMSVEAGIKKEFTSGSYLTASAYATRVKNTIEYVYLWNSDKPLDELNYADARGDTYVNAGDQLTRGVEIEAFLQLSEKFRVKGNVSATNTRYRILSGNIDPVRTGGQHVQLYNLGAFLGDGIEQDHVVRRPDLTAFARLTWSPFARWQADATWRYTGKRFDAGYDASLGPFGALSRVGVGAYHLIDLGVQCKVTQAFSTALKVENILDEDYRELVGFQTRGRSVYLKASLRF